MTVRHRNDFIKQILKQNIGSNLIVAIYYTFLNSLF